MKRAPWQHRFAASFVLILLALGITAVQAAIPASERTVLLNLYTSTNGAAWTTSTNWNGPAGTECTWFGVTCDVGQTTVTGIDLHINNLTGTLPANLNNLTNLSRFIVYSNQLTGSIPALIGFTSLVNFEVGGNQLTGSIPALTGLANLQSFDAANNQLTGSIPALTGLTNLVLFQIGNNQLTGTIPALTGLTNLVAFNVQSNQLTGSIPALTGLTNLLGFFVNGNQLTGTIPALTGLTRLGYFVVSSNQLTGNVPSVPSPNALSAGLSLLCPNFLNHTPDPAWDAATGVTPWYTDCTGITGSITPHVGLWWNPAESGTGYALDYKHGVLVVAAYSYTAAGPPIWYLASGPVINNTFTTTLDKYQNGQCISCAYRPATINGNDGTISITFTSSTSAMMTLPGGRNFQIVPFDF